MSDTAQAREVRTKDCGVARASRSSLFRAPPVQRTRVRGTLPIAKDCRYLQASPPPATNTNTIATGVAVVTKSCLSNPNRQPLSVFQRVGRGLCYSHCAGRMTGSAATRRTVIKFYPEVTVYVMNEEGHLKTEVRNLHGERPGFLFRRKTSGDLLHDSDSGNDSPTDLSPPHSRKGGIFHNSPSRDKQQFSPSGKLGSSEESDNFTSIRSNLSGSPTSPGAIIPDNQPNIAQIKEKPGKSIDDETAERDKNSGEYSGITAPPPSPAVSEGGDVTSQMTSGGMTSFTGAIERPTPCQEKLDGTWMKFTLPLGNAFRAKDILVRANVTGNHIRVTARCAQNEADGFDERYPVPLPVNPFLLKAKFDTEGNLTVTAPLKDTEQTPQDMTSVREVVAIG